ncbi:MAG: tRNA pseudouridine(55) synthase TruB [Chitinophagales bacterium]
MSIRNPTENKYAEGQVILINKALNWTSFDVVRKINRLLNGIKVGHAGTLDPLATGLLILCTGKFTKKIQEYMGMEKEYLGTFHIGATTPTYDLESEPANFKEISSVTESQIRSAFERWTGEVMQIPPVHSAIKKGGRRAYEYARKGNEIVLAPRKILIRTFELREFRLPEISFRVVCSTGTYIRSLAQDIGVELGCGAYLSSLCRSRIGTFELEQALSMEEAEAQIRRDMTDQNG